MSEIFTRDSLFWVWTVGESVETNSVQGQAAHENIHCKMPPALFEIRIQKWRVILPHEKIPLIPIVVIMEGPLNCHRVPCGIHDTCSSPIQGQIRWKQTKYKSPKKVPKAHKNSSCVRRHEKQFLSELHYPVLASPTKIAISSPSSPSSGVFLPL